jgi:restriction endonuclease
MENIMNSTAKILLGLYREQGVLSNRKVVDSVYESSTRTAFNNNRFKDTTDTLTGDMQDLLVSLKRESPLGLPLEQQLNELRSASAQLLKERETLLANTGEKKDTHKDIHDKAKKLIEKENKLLEKFKQLQENIASKKSTLASSTYMGQTPANE